MILDAISELTIYEIENLKDIFLALLKSQKDVVLDISNIEKIDMVGVQLLLSFSKSIDANGNRLVFENIPDNILQDIKISNCDKELGITHG